MKVFLSASLSLLVPWCGSSAQPLGKTEERFVKERLTYFRPSYGGKQKEPCTALFLHATVGIFKKKRPVGTNETWGYGREIMEEVLAMMQSSGLLTQPKTTVYVTLLGNDADRRLATGTLREFNASGNVHVHITGTNLYVAEFPTIKAIQLFSQHVHADSHLLYFHTKGMRNIGKHAVDWRRYAQYFLIEKHQLCKQALAQGYSTCGVQMTGEEYQGNFWWARSGWVARREMELLDMKWNMVTRFATEDFLLSPTVIGSNAVSNHLCLLHVDHNLYDCPTPRALYAALPVSLPDAHSKRGTIKVPMPGKLAEVTCPATRVVKSKTIKDNHGGACIEKLTLSSAS